MSSLQSRLTPLTDQTLPWEYNFLSRMFLWTISRALSNLLQHSIKFSLQILQISINTCKDFRLIVDFYQNSRYLRYSFNISGYGRWSMRCVQRLFRTTILHKCCKSGTSDFRGRKSWRTPSSRNLKQKQAVNNLFSGKHHNYC